MSCVRTLCNISRALAISNLLFFICHKLTFLLVHRLLFLYIPTCWGPGDSETKGVFHLQKHKNKFRDFFTITSCLTHEAGLYWIIRLVHQDQYGLLVSWNKFKHKALNSYLTLNNNTAQKPRIASHIQRPVKRVLFQDWLQFTLPAEARSGKTQERCAMECGEAAVEVGIHRNHWPSTTWTVSVHERGEH